MRRERDTCRQPQVDNLLARNGWDRNQVLPEVEQVHIAGQYGVSGFDPQQGYDAREPTWAEDDGPFPSETEAMQAAKAWLAAKGSGAQVEILHFVTDKRAEVVAVATQGGGERIGSL